MAAYHLSTRVNNEASGGLEEATDPVPKLKFERLRCFIAVGECLHFGKAAKRLYIVQSAVSQQIKLLEQEIGVELLRRASHRVELTDAGVVLLEQSKRAFNLLNEAVRSAKDAAVGNLARLNIGFVDNAQTAVLLPILHVFRASYPNTKINLRQMIRSEQIKALDDGEIDIGLFPGLPSASNTESKVLVEAPLVVALPFDHRLTSLDLVPLEQLSGEDFVLFPNEMRTRLAEMTRAACAVAGFSPRVAQEATQISTLLTLVGAGVGVTLVPKWISSPHQPGVEFRDIDATLPPYQLLLAWQRGATNTAVHNFRAVVSEIDT